jgi:hypothetical protein
MAFCYEKGEGSQIIQILLSKGAPIINWNWRMNHTVLAFPLEIQDDNQLGINPLHHHPLGDPHSLSLGLPLQHSNELEPTTSAIRLKIHEL